MIVVGPFQLKYSIPFHPILCQEVKSYHLLWALFCCIWKILQPWGSRTAEWD